MASVIDKYVFALMLDAKGFKKGGSEAIGVLGGIKNAFLKTYSLVGGFDLFKNMLHTYTDAAKSIDDFSLITGENTIKLQAWQKAIQDTGGDVKGLQGTIRRIADMQAQLARYGTAEGLQEFLRIGIDPRGKTAFKIIEEAGKKLALVKDNAKAFNIAKSIGLDESTFIMLRRYGNDFGKVIKANERFAFINKQAIQDTREYNRIVSSFKTSWLQLSQSVMKQVLPVLEKDLFPAIERITQYLVSDVLPVLTKDILPAAERTASVIKEWTGYVGAGIGEMVGEAEQNKSLSKAQFEAGKRAKEAGLSFMRIAQMSSLLKDVKDAQIYGAASNAYINITLNAPQGLNEKQLANYTVNKMEDTLTKLGLQVGNIQK